MAKSTKPARTPSEEKKRKFTRAQAEQQIARTSDLGELASDDFAKHANKHVRKKAAYKLSKLSSLQA